MHGVHHPEGAVPAGAPVVAIAADRLTLAKTRWRGVAADGAEFGFDLHQPIRHGQVAAVIGGVAYRIEQAPEPVLVVEPKGSPSDWARVAWTLGNLHQSVEVRADAILVADDSAARAALGHLGVSYRLANEVFQPMRGAGHGHHHHGH